jgi:short subunit dehydrogenase-like uncharacterized protein
VKRYTSQVTNVNLDHVEVFTADIDDLASLKDVTSKTRVIIATAGPFAKVGSAVVDACVSSSTNYVDITGEVQWVRKMIDKHHAEAASKKIKIISCCGFDCIPVDLGTNMIVTEMKKKGLTPVYARSTAMDMVGGASGGTIASVMNIFETCTLFELKALLNPYYLSPKIGNELDIPTNSRVVYAAADKVLPEYDSIAQKWVAPFAMQAVDTRIVNRSNAISGWSYGKDFVYSEAMKMPNVFAAILVSLLTPISMFLLYFSIPRRIAQFFVPQPGEGPDVDFLEKKGMFEVLLWGKGTDSNGRTKIVTGRVYADKGDAGYVQTAKMVCEAGICLAKDSTSPVYGHVTPSIGLGEVLTNRLRARGMDFSVISL